ncbi:hypothetical protein AMJ80_01615 [bacterium SM23_31]|nr:MAG: hypothetical protein AMJ80_01615 [bacterium SM23_31]
MNIIFGFHRGSRAKFYIYIFGFAILTLILTVYIGCKSTTNDEVETFEVQYGEFIVDVEVTGELKAHRSENIKGSRLVSTNLKIAKLAPEGETVKEGDFLIQFDTSEIEDKIEEQKLDLAEKNLELEALLAKKEIDSIKLERELKIQQLSFEQQKMNFALAQFKPKSEQRKMQVKMEQAETNYNDKLDEIKSKKLEGRETINRKYNEVKKISNLINTTKKQIESSTIYAPIPGLVVYKEVYTGLGSYEKIRVGSTVYYHDILIELPDLSKMCVKAELSEIDIANVKLDQEVIVTIDRDESVYPGSVIYIAPIERLVYTTAADGTRKERSVYDMEIAIGNTENDGSLKPGMAATCRIITDKFQNTLYIPVQAVFEMGDETFVYVKDDGKYKKTPVVVGKNNKDYIIIEEGLESGQLVTIGDPYKKLQEIQRNIKEKTKIQDEKRETKMYR